MFQHDSDPFGAFFMLDIRIGFDYNSYYGNAVMGTSTRAGFGTERPCRSGICRIMVQRGAERTANTSRSSGLNGLLQMLQNCAKDSK